MRRFAVLFAMCAAVSFISGCGGAAKGEAAQQDARQGSIVHLLRTSQAKRALLALPYSYTFRKVALPRGARGALAGRVVGAHKTVLHFGIALGQHPDAVPVPHSGMSEIGQYPGFVYTDDELVPGRREKWEPGPQFHTAAQWKEVARMSVAMVERLCRAETHQPCPIGE